MQVMRKAETQLVCPDLFASQRVLVVGLGKTGLSCARFLAERKAEFAVMDSREQPPGLYEFKNEYPGIEIYTGVLDSKIIAGFEVLIVSPGIALKEPALQQAAKAGKQIIGDIEILAQCTSKPVVAITGSNGKSTVTTLLGDMAKKAKMNTVIAGNIGIPVLDLINADDKTDLYVLELSSFQLETTQTLDATASTILNLSEDHMDRYESLSDYAEAKHKVISGDGTVVVNLDDAFVQSLIENDIKSRKVLGFTLYNPTSPEQFGLRKVNGELWLSQGEQQLIPTSSLKIKGQHNVANVLAALALGTAINLPIPAMLEAAKQFTGLPHRTQWVTEHNGVQWFNDSKATNIGAAIAAIVGMASKNLILILGGQGKGQDFEPLRTVIEEHVKQVLLFGEDAEVIDQTLGNKINKKIVPGLEQADIEANRIAAAGDIVLLSPACASFDMFSGYEQRGNEFMRLVKEVTS